MNQRVLIAIPTFQCARQVVRVIDGLFQLQTFEHEIKRVIIVDNQSQDETISAAIHHIEKLKLQNWIWVFQNKINYGLGGTHKLIFEYAKQNEFTHVIILHGDDQALVSEVPLVVASLTKEAPVVLGSRFIGGARCIGYSKIRTMGNVVLNFIFSVMSGRKIYDLGSGLNGFDVQVISNLRFFDLTNTFNFNAELLLEMISQKVPFKFIPITWREEDQVSNARNLKVGLLMLKSLILWRLGFCQKSAEASPASFVRILN